jgi:uncharacterized membrane protein
METEDFTQLWKRLDDEATAQEIISQMEFWVTEKLFSDGVTENIQKVLVALQSKIAAAPENALAIAKAARQAVRNVIRKRMEAIGDAQKQPQTATLIAAPQGAKPESDEEI